MKLRLTTHIVFISVLAFSLIHKLYAEHDGLPNLIVEGTPIDKFNKTLIDPDISYQASQDTSAMFRSVPGGSSNYNGGFSSQPQYRGMYGPRVNVLIDGAYVESGGPNWMDPPLHYLPPSLVDSVEVTRGIASVSTGSGIGGYANAKSKSSEFSNSDEMTHHGDVSIGGQEVNGGYQFSGIVSTSNRNHRVHLLGSHDEADDTEFDGGTIEGTDFEKTFVGLGYGYQDGINEFMIDLRRTNTDNSGTPVLPLDIAFFKTNQLNTGFNTRILGYDLVTKFYATKVRHQMDNFRLRPTPDFSASPLPPFVDDDKRQVDVESHGYGWSVIASKPLASGIISFGTDGKINEHDATVSDPDFDPFFIDNFNDAEVNHFGLFTEWQGDITNQTALELGVRIEHVTSDSGFVNAFPAVLADNGVPLDEVVAAQDLRDRFNSSDLSQNDTNVDAVIKLNHQLNNALEAELGLARKSRSASYLERYLWLPLEVNAGLGDGNNYVGNPALDPEVSHQIELGLNFDNSKLYLSPRVYYKHIDDYIQGIASADASTIAFSGTAAGDATPLVFSNVDAEIYGFDTGFGYLFNAHWRVDGSLAYTRGKRRDVDDDLYRIAPLNARLALTYSGHRWRATIEGEAFSEQDNISNTLTLDPANSNNSNAATSGYALLNLYGQVEALHGFSIRAGVENLLDKQYTNHLSGFNRNTASDVPQGQRLAGAGRNVFALLSYRW